ncbi:MAG: hypothetical protein CVV28_09660 [Methanobacteriales archaeon HGW-Methanobacteriales-1]|nr:MAG: hypothetical protein CVV28_09660 [Methanobacteriales archaeon HGW-Methanobacteriales-1]
MKDKLKQLQNKLNFKKSNKSKLLNKNTNNNHKLTCTSSSCPLISPWGIIAIIAIFTIFIASFFVPYHNIQPTATNNTTENMVASKEILGNDSMGVVTKEGPYGNLNSTIKIAYILGQHPRESRSHNATMANIRENSNSLKNCYYLYYINVTEGTYDYYEGRLNGQKLAYKYIVPDINKNNYSLIIDVHASNGRYIDKSFTFVPFSDSESLKIAKNLTVSLKWLYYYSMPEPSSPSYSTIPIIKNGTPAIIYEAYANPSNTIKQQVKDFIMAVDQLKL